MSTIPTTAFQPFGDEILGLADEVAGRVVDEDVDAAEMADHARDHLVDLLGLSHVDLDRLRVQTRVAQFGGAALEMFGAPAANRDERTELAEPRRDREPETGAAAGDRPRPDPSTAKR